MAGFLKRYVAQGSTTRRSIGQRAAVGTEKVRAGIAGAVRISPHSLRHSFVTELLANGVPLQDVQEAVGHADPRRTRAYDRSRRNLDRHPTYTMATQLHRTAPGESGVMRADSQEDGHGTRDDV
jgi:integrase